MASLHAPLHTIRPNGAGKRIGIVAALWHQELTDILLNSAMATLEECGVKQRDVEVVRVPGAFEIPVAVAAMMNTHRFDALVALGVVIRGETPHFEYVAGPVSYALQNLSVEKGIPCAFGVLTTETEEQARERSGGSQGNKGNEAAYVALEMISILHEIQSGRHHA